MSETPEDRPPLGAWSRLYALVIAWLLVCIAAFWLFTRVFA